MNIVLCFLLQETVKKGLRKSFESVLSADGPRNDLGLEPGALGTSGRKFNVFELSKLVISCLDNIVVAFVPDSSLCRK